MNVKSFQFNGKRIVEIKNFFSDVSNTFTYEFWVKPRRAISLPPQTNSGISVNKLPQQWVIGANHRPENELIAGVGISVGINGIAVYEHGHNHFPATLVHRTKIKKLTHVAIVYEDKVPSLFINGTFVKKGLRSKKETLYPSGIIGALEKKGYFRGFIGDIRIWESARSKDQIALDVSSMKKEEKHGLLLYLHQTKDGLLVKEGSFIDNSSKKIIFPKPSGECLVSIIIPVYNKWDHTQLCLNSIYKNTDNINYEIIIADDMSTDKTKQISKYFGNIKVIRDGHNRGFVKNCNNAADHATGKYLLFLNNDTTAQKGWLAHLIALIESQENIGMVGGKLVHPDGTLQEAGSIIFNDGSCYGYGRGDDPNNPEYSYVREVHYCSGACILVKRNLFNLAGKFDKQFAPAYYEEVDLTMKIRELGYKVMYQPLTVVNHYEFGSSSSKRAAELQKQNKVKFQKKWAKKIKNYQPPHIKNALLGRNFNDKKPRLLIIDDRIPAPELGSGLPRTFSILECLKESGVNVTFFPLSNSKKTEPCTKNLQQKGIEVMYDTAKKKLDFKKFYLERKNFYDAIWISRPHNMEKLYNIIKSINPNQKIIYDVEAIFSKREILKMELDGIHLSEAEKDTMLKNEIELMKKADFLITVSKNDKEVIQKYVEKPIVVLSHYVEINKTENPFENRKDILFVGGFLSSPSPNEDAILYFVKNIFPTVHKELKAKLWIVGTNNAEKILNLSSEKIIVTGQVKDLSRLYNEKKVFIIPTRYAAGIPLKAIEAMSYGLPIIATPLIADQLNMNENRMLIGKDPKEFSQKVIELYQNENLWTNLRNNGLDQVKRQYNKHLFKESLLKLINLIKK